MCFKIILKVTKNQGLSLSLEDAPFETPRPTLTPAAAVLGLRLRRKNLFTKKFQKKAETKTRLNII